MKFNKWKKALRSQKIDIPDIYDRIKPYAYQKKYIPQEKFTLKKLRYRFAPVFVLFVFIILIIFSTGNNERNSYFSGNNYLSHFGENDNITEILNTERNKSLSYLQTYKETSITDPFRIQSEVPLQAENDTLLINEYQDTNQKVATEGKLIYYLSNNVLNIINTENQNLSLETSINVRDSSQNSRNSNTEFFLTEDYLILIYSEANDSNHPFSSRTNVMIHNKYDYEAVYSYQVYGNYLDAWLLDNQIFLINTINLNDYVDSNIQVPLPVVIEDGEEKEISYKDIGYLEGFTGETYTIITTLNLSDEIKSDDAFLLSYDVWKIISVQRDGIYLINNHLNTDDQLEYGTYTAIIHYTYDDKTGLNYSSSCKFKGHALNPLSFSEENGYIRMVITVVDYEITKSLFQTRIKPSKVSNRVIVLKELRYRSGKIMSLIGSLELDSSDLIQAVRFDENLVLIQTNTNLLYCVDLKNYSNPKTFQVIDAYAKPLFFYELEDLEISLKSDLNQVGYTLNFYSPEELEPWKNNYQIRYNDYNYLPVIEAVHNRNAYFNTSINGNQYFGFSVTNYNQSEGHFLLFEIDTIMKSYQLFQFTNNYKSSQTCLNRMVSIDHNEVYFYLLSDNLIVAMNDDFVNMGFLVLPSE